MVRRTFILRAALSAGSIFIPKLGIPSQPFTQYNGRFGIFHTPTADEYEKYVNSAIPLSKELANGEAILREFRIFDKWAANAQSHLAIASGAATNFCALCSEVKDVNTLIGTDGSVDIGQALKQLYILTQLIYLQSSIRKNLTSFKLIKEDLVSTESPDFRNYDLKNINLIFAHPDVELPDGLFIPLIGYDAYTTAVALVYDVYQVIQNEKEISKIKELAQKLNNEKVKLNEYKSYAAKCFNEYKSLYFNQFEEYSIIYEAYSEWINDVSELDLLKQHNYVLNLMNKYNTDYVDQFRFKAKAYVHNKLKGDIERDDNDRLSIVVNLRMLSNYNLLNKNKVEDVETLIEQFQADFALIEVYNLTSSRALASHFKEYLRNKASNSISLDLTSNASFKTDLYYKPFEWDGLKLKRLHKFHFIEPSYISKQTCIHSSNEHTFNCLCFNLKNNETNNVNNKAETRTNKYGGYSHINKRELVNYYESGGGINLVFFDTLPHSWKNDRLIIEGSFDIPGSFSLASTRADRFKKRFDQHLASMQERNEQFNQIAKDIAINRSNYLENTIRPAIKQNVQQVSKMKTIVNTVLNPLLKKEYLSENLPPVLPILPNTEIASTPIRELHTKFAKFNGDYTTQWSYLENLAKVQQLRHGDINIPDYRIVSEMYDAHYDSNGILKINSIGNTNLPKEAELVAVNISNSIKTSINTTNGRKIRTEINRGLLASSLNNEGANNAFGSLSLVVAADIAYSEGNTEAGNSLFENGAVAIDLILGIIPVVGSINDATQILYGIATGRDYTGKPMGKADYALRSLGVLIGLVPGGSVMIGSQRVTLDFIKGSNIFMKLNIGAKIHNLFFPLKAAKEYLFHVTEAVGRWFPEQILKIIDPKDLEFEVMQLVGHQGEIANKVKNTLYGGIFEDHVIGLLPDIEKNTKWILRGEATNRAYRIPDILNEAKRFIGEIKSSKILDMDDQFRDFFKYCKGKNPPFTFKLYVMPDTIILPNLKAELKAIGAEVYTVDTFKPTLKLLN